LGSYCHQVVHQYIAATQPLRSLGIGGGLPNPLNLLPALALLVLLPSDPIRAWQAVVVVAGTDVRISLGWICALWLEPSFLQWLLDTVPEM
jgi:hypothetical protein